jgi:hypothetical protein
MASLTASIPWLQATIKQSGQAIERASINRKKELD